MKAISIIIPIKLTIINHTYTCTTTSNHDNKFIVNYFFNTLKGIKSFQYRI